MCEPADARQAPGLQGTICMNECSIRTQGAAPPDDLAERDTISRLIKTRRADSAVPIEIAPERTERYPVGLGEELCSLSACRPRPGGPRPH